jgi:ABC-type spermidine/putrescine transport system permease subunit I
MKLTRGAFLLLVPGTLILLLFMVFPLANVVEKSIRVYNNKDIFGDPDLPYTLANYAEMIHPVYVGFFVGMIRISLIATTLGVALAFPIAYYIARRPEGAMRTFAVGFLVAFLFLSVLVRVYSIQLTFGTVGFGRAIAGFFDVRPSSRVYAEFLVILGLMHHNIPLSSLILISAIQNVNPRLVDAAQALGAPRWSAHLAITVPLSIRGLLSAFLINYMISISAFVNPMVLGKGKVHFMSNLIFTRYDELVHYPGGSAIAVQLLVLAFIMVYAIQAAAPARWGKA